MAKTSFKHLRKARYAAVGIIGASLLSGCEDRFGMPAPVTQQGHSVMHLWHFCLYTATAIGVVVFGFLLYSIVRHRRKTDELPPQTEGHVGLEITWTIIPLIIVAILFGYGLQAQETATKLERNPGLLVNVTGYQWNWRFAYPGYDNVTVAGGQEQLTDETTFPEMVLPVNTRIRFDLVAADVNHAFFVPDFLTKRDLIPGIRNEIEITPQKTGEYVGHCAEYCGLNHSQMNFRVKVVSQADFQTWIQQMQQTQSQAGGVPNNSDPKIGVTNS